MNDFLGMLLKYEVEMDIKITDLHTIDICFIKKLNRFNNDKNNTIKSRVMIDAFDIKCVNIGIERILIEKLYEFINYYNEKLLEEKKENE